MTLQRWKLTIEYDGRPYAGWQRQRNAISAQEALESAIRSFCQQDIVVHAAGRTDAGVHARGQVAHFDLDYGGRELTNHSVMRAINAHLIEESLSVLDARPVTQDFHARFSAVNKLYTYRILCRAARPAIDKGFVWHTHYDLDLEAMRAGARHLIGRHDFSAFRDADCQAQSPVKTLDRLDLEERAYNENSAKEILIHAEGRSFLHHQVRNMVGTLSLIGRGKWAPDQMRDALESRDRKQAGPTAPPDGLYLMRIDY